MNIAKHVSVGDSVSFVVRGKARAGVVESVKNCGTGNEVLTIKFNGEFRAFKGQDISGLVNWTERAKQ